MKVFKKLILKHSAEMGVRPLARAMKMAGQSLSAYLLDTTEPRIKNLQKMSDYFQMSIGELLMEVADVPAITTRQNVGTGLVTVCNGEARITTLAIAEGTDNQHKAVIQLVRTYLTDLEEFGRVAFEMAPFKTAGGTQKREVANLNEQQSTLIMTYMKNSEIVRTFKKRLVKAFFELANRQAVAIVPTLRTITVNKDRYIQLLEAENGYLRGIHR